MTDHSHNTANSKLQSLQYSEGLSDSYKSDVSWFSAGFSTRDSPSLLNTWDTDDDCVYIVLHDEVVSELKHLAVTLGIDNQLNGKRQVNYRAANLRWNPVKESVVQQWWKHSKKWTKHNEEESRQLYPRPEKRTKQSTRQRDNSNSKKSKRKNNPVVIPGIGCSYRLPVIKRPPVK